MKKPGKPLPSPEEPKETKITRKINSNRDQSKTGQKATEKKTSTGSNSTKGKKVKAKAKISTASKSYGHCADCGATTAKRGNCPKCGSFRIIVH
mmetsp:Transcript_36914/g.68135  ORF Transcript_36914/g.68135 Transcript_36914/m.68135 type:complete len:94 (+) Transcript_36914:1376-1657(+)